MIPFIWHSSIDKTTGMENRAMVARSWRWKEELTTKGHRGTFGDDGTVLYRDYGGSYKTVCKCRHLYYCSLKKSEGIWVRTEENCSWIATKTPVLTLPYVQLTYLSPYFRSICSFIYVLSPLYRTALDRISPLFSTLRDVTVLILI